MIDQVVLAFIKKCNDDIKTIPREIRDKAIVTESGAKWFKRIKVDWQPYLLSKKALDRHQLLNHIKNSFRYRYNEKKLIT